MKSPHLTKKHSSISEKQGQLILHKARRWASTPHHWHRWPAV